MKPEDVPEELLRAFLVEYHDVALRNPVDSARAALAAVIPLIEAREREACAEVADDYGFFYEAESRACQRNGETDLAGYLIGKVSALDAAATAIRARGERT